MQGKCDLLVTDAKEYQISAELWDLDGAEGIIADQFYSGEEKEFLTIPFDDIDGFVDNAFQSGTSGTATQEDLSSSSEEPSFTYELEEDWECSTSCRSNYESTVKKYTPNNSFYLTFGYNF